MAMNGKIQATQHGKHVASQRLKASPPFLADLLFENSTYLSSSHSVQTCCSSTLDEASKFQLFFLSSPKRTAHLPPNPPHSLCLHALFGLSLSHTQTHKLAPLASSLTPIHGLNTLPRFHSLWVHTAHSRKHKLC